MIRLLRVLRKNCNRFNSDQEIRNKTWACKKMFVYTIHSYWQTIKTTYTYKHTHTHTFTYLKYIIYTVEIVVRIKIMRDYKLDFFVVFLLKSTNRVFIQ